jgi:hypothetical protein
VWTTITSQNKPDKKWYGAALVFNLFFVTFWIQELLHKIIGAKWSFNSEQDRQCAYNVILMRVRGTIVVEKEWVLHIPSVCVCSLSYAARNAHAPYYIVICGLCGCIIFFHIISYTARFAGEKFPEGKFFFIQRLSEIYLILRRIHRGTIVSVHGYLCRVPVVLVRL